MDTIGARLEHERNRLGLSQKDFDSLFDLSQSTYKEYKAGKKKMPADVFMRICAHLNWAPEYLYYGKGEVMSDPRSHLEAQLLHLFRALPEDQRETVLSMVKVATDGITKANRNAG